MAVSNSWVRTSVKVISRRLPRVCFSVILHHNTGEVKASDMDIDGAAEWATAQRVAGRKIAFANGVFDIIHPGHVMLLEKARSMGDVLIVAINSDASTQRLKGPTRPLISQDGRSCVLSALRCVDAVAIFEDDIPLRIILAVQPHVIVKGGDYTPETVVGNAECRQWGGRVVIVPTDELWSTTKIVDQHIAKLSHAPRNK